MRRFPCSWDTTLAALGLRRKRRKRFDSRHRSSQLEMLEMREMLAADTLLGNESHRWSFDAGNPSIPGSFAASLQDDATIVASGSYVGLGALSLDGSGDYASIDDDAMENWFTQYSVTAWYKADGAGSPQIIFEEGESSNGIALRLNNTTLEAKAIGSIGGPPTSLRRPPASVPASGTLSRRLFIEAS